MAVIAKVNTGNNIGQVKLTKQTSSTIASQNFKPKPNVALTELTDVSIVNAQDGNVLVFESSTGKYTTQAINAVTSANGTIAWNTANAAFVAANAAFVAANSASVAANVATATDTTQNNSITAAFNQANAAFAAANTVTFSINTIPTGTSVTINGDTTDLAIHINTQVAGTLTINAPTGTPVDGQKIMIRLVSTNVQTFSWNAIFAGSNDIPLPTVSTGSGKYDYIGFIYNSAATKWQILAKNFGF